MQVKDIVRAMIVVPSMTHVAVLVSVIMDLQQTGVISVLRVKDRFVKEPSGGGRHQECMHSFFRRKGRMQEGKRGRMCLSICALTHRITGKAGGT